MVLASVRVCKIWKNCQLDLAAATGRNCLIWGKEAVLGDADENKKLTGNAESKPEEPSPTASSRLLQSLWCPLLAESNTASWQRRSAVCSVPESQIHKGVNLKPRDNSLITVPT